jgi:hypothetical protein
LPSQLEKEDAKTISEFIIIDNELETQRRDKLKQMESKMRMT